MLFKLIFALLFLKLSSAQQYCVYKQDELYLNCSNFDSFSQLNFNSFNKTNKIKKFSLRPSKPVLFEDEYLNLAPLSNSFEDDYTVLLENFNKLDIKSNPFSFNQIQKQPYELIFNDITVSFEVNGQPLSSNCDLDLFERTSLTMFDSFQVVRFNKNIKYEDELCPVLFRQNKLKKLTLNELGVGNEFKFIDFKSPLRNRTLDPGVEELELFNADLDFLDFDILSPVVFKKLKQLRYSNLNDKSSDKLLIVEDLFKSFRELKQFELELYDMGLFVNKSNPNWMYNLNPAVAINLNIPAQLNDPANKNKQFKLVLKDMSEAYEFPDEDFCFFDRFPHSKLVFPIVHTKPGLKCSCTLLWILKYWSYYVDTNEISTDSVKSCIEDNFEGQIDACDFSELKMPCKKEITTAEPEPIPTTTQVSTTTIGIVEATTAKTSVVDTMTLVFIGVGGFSILSAGILFVCYMVRKRVNRKAYETERILRMASMSKI